MTLFHEMKDLLMKALKCKVRTFHRRGHVEQGYRVWEHGRMNARDVRMGVEYTGS